MNNLFIKYFSIDFIFSVNPKTNHNLLIVYIILFVLILVAGLFISRIFTKKSNKMKPYKIIQEKIFNHTLFLSITGLILTFFAWQQIPYLSAPILIYILVVILIYLAIQDIIFYKKKIIPKVKKFKQEREYTKYLPGKN